MRIAVLDDYQQVARRLAEWDRLDAEVRFFTKPIPEEDLVETLAPFDVVVAMRERTPFPASLIRKLHNLRLLVTTGRRNASIDLATAREREVTVCGTESSPYGTPELTFALMHLLARQLIPEIESVRHGGWQLGLGSELHGAALGIIGLGRLGARVATIAHAYGMRGGCVEHQLDRRTQHRGGRGAPHQG